MKKIIILFMSVLLMFASCDSSGQHNHDNNNEQEIPTVALTQWTDKMEIFMEWETPLIDNPVKFIIHLTTLTDFQPIRDGKVILEFKDSDNNTISFEENELLREGIFTSVVTFDKIDEYDFILTYVGDDISEIFEIGKLTVFPSIQDMNLEEEDSGGEISFLKEQQWKIDFATSHIVQEKVLNAINTIGEVVSNPETQAIIVSPANGILSIERSNIYAKPGQRVKKGQILGVLVPPAGAQGSWTKVYLDYEQAKADFQRAERLKNKDAISKQDFDRIRREYDIHQAGIIGLLGNHADGYTYDSDRHQFEFLSPFDGVISKVNGVPGQQTEAGTELFTIIDPTKTWLKLQLHISKSAELNTLSGVSLMIPGMNDLISIKEKELNLISIGEFVDKSSGTVPLFIEVKNPHENLKIGQRFSAKIFSTPEIQMLTVPRSAVYEENGRDIVFIHTSGESFEKRFVEIGPDYLDKKTIKNGVHEGERVVSKGGYQVKLASTSEEIGHPHTH